MVVANCGANCQGQRLFIEISTRLRTANAAAAPDSGVFGNGCNFGRRTAWEQLRNQLDHLRNQFAILFATLHCSPCPRCCPLIGVLNAFLLGLLQRGLFHQNSLPLVALTSPIEAHDNGGPLAVLGGPSRQSCVASRKKLQAVEARTGKAKRLVRFHQEHGTLRNLCSAFRALRVAQVQKHDWLRSLFELLLKLLLLMLRERGRYVVRTEDPLDVGVAAAEKLQRHGSGPGKSHIAGFTWLEALFLRPTQEDRYGRRDLVRASLNL